MSPERAEDLRDSDAAPSTDGNEPVRLFLLLPLMFAAHVSEELTQGFPAWATVHFGRITTPKFFLLSHVPLVAGAIGAAALGNRRTRLGVFLALGALATLVTNGVFHVASTLILREYSPGLVTSLLVYGPCTIYMLREVRARRLATARDGTLAFLAGTVVSLLIVASLFVDFTLV